MKTSGQNPWNSLVMGRPGDGMSFLANEVIRQQIADGGVTVIIDAGQSQRTLARALAASEAPKLTTVSKGSSDD